MNKSLVSVIVPLYNYQKYISDCITSIKNQSFEDWEAIIVDDCSTDDSFQIAKTFECDKIKVFRHNKNRGYSVAKNTGIINSKGGKQKVYSGTWLAQGTGTTVGMVNERSETWNSNQIIESLTITASGGSGAIGEGSVIKIYKQQ